MSIDWAYLRGWWMWWTWCFCVTFCGAFGPCATCVASTVKSELPFTGAPLTNSVLILGGCCITNYVNVLTFSIRIVQIIIMKKENSFEAKLYNNNYRQTSAIFQIGRCSLLRCWNLVLNDTHSTDFHCESNNKENYFKISLHTNKNRKLQNNNFGKVGKMFSNQRNKLKCVPAGLRPATNCGSSSSIWTNDEIIKKLKTK